jgi:hypothetical protein
MRDGVQGIDITGAKLAQHVQDVHSQGTTTPPSQTTHLASPKRVTVTELVLFIVHAAVALLGQGHGAVVA